MENKPMQQNQNNSSSVDPNPSHNKPRLAGESSDKDKTSSSYDLVEQMQYLYVRVVKARDMAAYGWVELVAEVKLGNYSGITKPASLSNVEWGQLFAFSKECIQSSTTVEIIVKESSEGSHVGRVWFDLSNVPSRVPGDSQLVPRWYMMEDKTGDKARTGELMASIWFGTQYDEAFAEATNVPFDGLRFTKSKVYHSPKLWYLRVVVLEAEHIMPGHQGPEVVRFPRFSVKVQVGNQHAQFTSVAPPSATRSFSNPFWNEDLMLVVKEPFVNSLRVSVLDQFNYFENVVMAMVEFPLATIEKRADERPVTSRWFKLDSHYGKAGDNNKPSTRFVPRICLRVSIDEGYHVFDETIENSGDFRPSDSRLWKPPIGVLEIGILGANLLTPAKVKDGEECATNAYCVAKYGPKWYETRTVVDSLSPKWNEQYDCEVYDLFTVVTVGVFGNCRIVENNTENAGASDYCFGKVRIRLSMLETDRVYTHSYPLQILTRHGLEKRGELHLCVRLSCSNATKMLFMYTMPLLPRMHFVDPLSVKDLDYLRFPANNLVASRLSIEEPPLGKEVVEFMLKPDTLKIWSNRTTFASVSRLKNSLSSLEVMGMSLKAIRDWQRPVYSALFWIIFLALAVLPEFILPTILFCMAFMGLWRYRFRPCRCLPTDTTLGGADKLTNYELDGIFDTFPTSLPYDIVRMRYDNLRVDAGKVQSVVGEVADQLERFQALVSWRDPRATVLFMVLCLVAAVVSYFVPIRVVMALFVLYLLRPPWFRSKLPFVALCFFQRLPTRVTELM